MIAVPLILSVLIQGSPAIQAKQPSPEDQVQALGEAYEVAFQDFVRAIREAKTEAEREILEDLPGRKPRDFAQRFMALAETYPGTAAAEDALIWVCSNTFGTQDCEEAKRRLAKDHARSAKLGPALGFQGHYGDYFEGSEAFFRSVLAENPHHEVRGQACYWLARHLLHKAKGVRAVRERPDFGVFEGVDLYKEVYGADWAARLRRIDPGALEREAEALFERVARYYADVPHNDKRRVPGTLGEASQSYLRERLELAVGRPAPEIEGTDLDGRPFRLSDYWGQVVVLDFGSHFYCGLCRETYPQMRALTERHHGRPFAVISINSEPEKRVEQLKEAWTAEGNTWRCLFDGTWEGPIQKAWNVQFFPTIYVLDREGVIRFRNLRGHALEEAVEALLEELPRK